MREAAFNGTREVATAITVVHDDHGVGLPAAGLHGRAGQRVLPPFAIAVTLALLASLLVALTIVPVLAALLHQATKAGDAAGGGKHGARTPSCSALYTPTLRLALRNGWTKLGTLALALILFAGSLLPLALGAIGFSFLSFGSDKVLTANIKLKPGTDISTTSNAGRGHRGEAGTRTRPVSNYQTTIGTNTEGGRLRLRRAGQRQHRRR